MVIEQKRFFNASIRAISGSLGWSNQPSQLTVDLVEDTRNGDSFTPTHVGWPAYFSYYGFAFGGILQKTARVGSFQGNPLFQVTLTDPREILAGTQLIIDGFTGTTSVVPNLYNVYGFLENISYGGAQTNETGMPSNLIKNAFTALVNQTAINFREQPFLVDLTLLPELPDTHRVGGGVSISVLDFIDTVCVDAACDYFFGLVLTPVGHVIKVYTISRRTAPLLGAISDFLEANPECISNENGVELRNEPTSKFIVGGDVEQMFYQTPSALTNDEEEGLDPIDFSDDNILQFWGFDDFGNARIQQFNEALPKSPTFTLNVRSLNITNLPDQYPTDAFEMRAVLGGQAAWEAFLWIYNETATSPHFGKAEHIGIIGPVREDIKAALNDLSIEEIRALDPRKLAQLGGKEILKAGKGIDIALLKEFEIARLFEALRAFAETYYGRKWMVRVPFTLAKFESETNKLITSQEPSLEGGYIEEALFPFGIDLWLLPIDSTILLNDQDKLIPYVRFDDAEVLDLSHLSIDDYTLSPYQDEEGNIKYFVFIKCDIDPKLVFINRFTAFSPRAVITLPGPVYPKLGEDVFDYAGVLRAVLTDTVVAKGMTEQEANAFVDEFFTLPGGEQFIFPMAGVAEIPDLAAVPLRSNILTYGPWFVNGAPGNTVFSQEATLVPWNYGSYEGMNLTASAMVDDSLSQMQLSEMGSIEVPDVPARSLGHELLAGGPYVTNVTISIGENGVTTNYRMETWTQRFGKIYKQNVERINRIRKSILDQRREIRNNRRLLPKIEVIEKRKTSIAAELPERVDRHSTHGYVMGNIIKNESTQKGTVNIAFSPTRHVAPQMSKDYDKKAMVSLDGLFVPFSTSTSASGIPHYETPTISGAGNRNVLELNPYQLNNGVFYTAQDSSYNDDTRLDEKQSANIRGIALRGPLVVAGWGYDISSKPVPNSNPNNPGTSFLSNYQEKPDRWKVGPVALEWEDSRKVWVPSAGAAVRVARLNGNLVGGANTTGFLLTPVFAGNNITSYTIESSVIRIYDPFAFQFPVTPSGARILVAREQTSQQWFVFAAGAF